MSALGQKQTFGHVRVMSALPPKADIDRALFNRAMSGRLTSLQIVGLIDRQRCIGRGGIQPGAHDVVGYPAADRAGT